MYCNQCEQTAKGLACTVSGVCGKKPEVAALQDALLYALKGLAMYAQEGQNQGLVDSEIGRFTAEAIFATLTNVNFDPERLAGLIKTAIEWREYLKQKCGNSLPRHDDAMEFTPAETIEEIIVQGEKIGMLIDKKADADIQSLQELLLYGIKGVSAYTHHAAVLGQEDTEVYAFIFEALAALASKEMELSEWLDLTMRCGKVNLRAMELLDIANTSAFGHPVPTEVLLGHRAGKCILVSGHDLEDLKLLLEATDGLGIDIYTHGEMLPAHGYPELKKYPHLYGNFGTAWQNQKKEFVDFPGPILMTTNCIQEPQESYKNNIFTTGPVGWPGVKHLSKDFSELINMALMMPGFDSTLNKGSVMVGFAHQTVLGVADKVIAAVKSGDLKHIFLVGGCDGAKSGRNYYTELVENTPSDTLVLTLGCGKYRFYDRKLGNINGIPRLLDMGQCNDAYSAIKVASALSQAFNCTVNDLPLSLVLSWYEQKAVSILLSLLYLGIKNIRLGPSLPAFVSPNVLKVLVDNFGIKPVNTVDQDLLAILG
ncbi:MAG TPA: hydroxylamine reductase [Syntrophomonadaceae bacterium]|nr:hydroxylamine reductase [Syntrophomonadaceae bacterium]